MVVYAKYKTNAEKDNKKENHQIALKDGGWRPSEPKRLKEIIFARLEKFKNTKIDGGADQASRVVRYLKRWNDIAMPYESDEKPIGLALLLFVLENLGPQIDFSGSPNDQKALEIVSLKASSCVGRIVIKKPTQEFEDLFGKISDDAMAELKGRFNNLYRKSLEIGATGDVSEACRNMKTIFGEDFPAKSLSKDKQTDSTRTELLVSAVNEVKNPIKPWS